jgi:hypothetical protein
MKTKKFKKFILTALMAAVFTTLAFSQTLTQVVRGTIVDVDSKLPLPGATLVISGTDPLVGTSTDINGIFRFEKVPIGRIKLQISYMGYETKTIPDIVVNSGKEVVLDFDMQWRLDGAEISSPYHLDDQNASFGALTALNNNLLANSDFYTGAFSSEYGDVISCVYDVKLRAGNNEKFEATGGIGLMGTELTLEGPFKKGYAGTYLFNYRYSSITLINDIGVIDVPGVVNYQDATFKIVLPTKKSGTFSFYGLGGKI